MESPQCPVDARRQEKRAADCLCPLVQQEAGIAEGEQLVHTGLGKIRDGFERFAAETRDREQRQRIGRSLRIFSELTIYAKSYHPVALSGR